MDKYDFYDFENVEALKNQIARKWIMLGDGLQPKKKVMIKQRRGLLKR